MSEKVLNVGNDFKISRPQDLVLDGVVVVESEGEHLQWTIDVGGELRSFVTRQSVLPL